MPSIFAFENSIPFPFLDFSVGVTWTCEGCCQPAKHPGSHLYTQKRRFLSVKEDKRRRWQGFSLALFLNNFLFPNNCSIDDQFPINIFISLNRMLFIFYSDLLSVKILPHYSTNSILIWCYKQFHYFPNS